MTHLEQWWTSLTTEEKERIASKIMTARNGAQTSIEYPVATKVWLELSESKQEAIYRHCTDRHGLLLPEYREEYIHGYLNDR